MNNTSAADLCMPICASAAHANVVCGLSTSVACHHLLVTTDLPLRLGRRHWHPLSAAEVFSTCTIVFRAKADHDQLHPLNIDSLFCRY